MKVMHIPEQVIDALEKGILRAVRDRIDKDPDVDSAYLRIIPEDSKFTVQVVHVSENRQPSYRRDVAMTDLMTETDRCMGQGIWAPDMDAIRALAESYSEILVIEISPN